LSKSLFYARKEDGGGRKLTYDTLCKYTPHNCSFVQNLQGFGEQETSSALGIQEGL
jgi:hypothetical protein